MNLKVCIFIIVSTLAFSCKKKDKNEPASDSNSNPTPPTPATIYTVTGTFASYHCYNIIQGSAYLNVPPGLSDIMDIPTFSSVTIQPNGSFTFTYSSASSYTSINFSYIIQNYQGNPLTKRTKTVPAYQNCDLGTYDFNALCRFYVRFKSLSNSPITNLELNSEQFVANHMPYTPVLGGPFTDTTIAYQHDMFKGFWQQDGYSGYDSMSLSTHLQLPMTFTCTYNNIKYTAQKTVPKCTQFPPTDTLFINLP